MEDRITLAFRRYSPRLLPQLEGVATHVNDTECLLPLSKPLCQVRPRKRLTSVWQVVLYTLKSAKCLASLSCDLTNFIALEAFIQMAGTITKSRLGSR